MRRAARRLSRLWAVVALLWGGCAHQEPATPAQKAAIVKSGAECQILAITIASTAPTCTDIKTGLAGLLKSSPECAEIFTGNSGFQVSCPGDRS